MSRLVCFCLCETHQTNNPLFHSHSCNCKEVPSGSCMSFVPNPTQANASNNNARVNTSGPAAAAAPTPEETETDTVFKVRTFDVYWVEKHALMYKDGTTTVSLPSNSRGMFLRRAQTLSVGLCEHVFAHDSAFYISLVSLVPLYSHS